MASLDTRVSPVFSMSSQGETVMTSPGARPPSRCMRSVVAMAMLAPALSPTKVMSAGLIPSFTRVSKTAVASSSWAG